MKTIIIMLGVLFCIHSSFGQLTINPQKFDKDDLWKVLLSIRDRGVEESGSELFRAVVAVMKDLNDHGTISVVHGDILSRDLIICNGYLFDQGIQGPFAELIHRACLILNQEMTKVVEPQEIHRGDVSRFITEVDKAIVYLDRKLQTKEAEMTEGMRDMYSALTYTRIAFKNSDPGFALSTDNIRFLRHMSLVAEDWKVHWNLVDLPKAMLSAAAVACSKLKFLDDSSAVDVTGRFSSP